MSIRIKVLIFWITAAIITVTMGFFIKAPTATINETHNTVIKSYILKDYNGMLAIFESGKETPIEVLDVNISSLPERDAEKIKNGIHADNLNEIFSFVEDYE